jgi:hypothetical protein
MNWVGNGIFFTSLQLWSPPPLLQAHFLPTLHPLHTQINNPKLKFNDTILYIYSFFIFFFSLSLQIPILLFHSQIPFSLPPSTIMAIS